MKKALTVIGWLFLFAFWAGAFAQSGVDGGKKAAITIQGDAIVQANGILHISDSLATELALEALSVDGKSFWLKKQNRVPDRAEVIHYWFDRNTRTLIIYFNPQHLASLRGKTVHIEVVGVQGLLSPGVDVKESTEETINLVPNP